MANILNQLGRDMGNYQKTQQVFEVHMKTLNRLSSEEDREMLYNRE